MQSSNIKLNAKNLYRYSVPLLLFIFFLNFIIINYKRKIINYKKKLI